MITCNFLIGIILGCLIAKIIPNPLIWLDEKYRDYKLKKRHFKDENAQYICDDHCFWGYEDCPHCKKNDEGMFI